MKRRHIIYNFLLIAALAVVPGTARAHAFPEHQTPGAGAELAQSPKAVTIRFDRAVEPSFSSLRVEDAAGKRVDINDSHIINGTNDTLEIILGPLVSGRYHVFWTAVARDGHRTHGDYTFIVRKKAP